MFSDTHFHFKLISEEWGLNGPETLIAMAENNCNFGLDIGTKADDLPLRQASCEKSISQINDLKLADRVRNFLYFSAGIWPDVEEIHDRENCIKNLRHCIKVATDDKDQDTLHRKIIAIGEAGLDHHWNPSGADGRNQSDFDEKTFYGERELFEMQIELAKEMNLPLIIHTRDAFEDTLDCLKNCGYHRGIIHCFSYGIEEARTFLDLGWYIAFGGAVTYNKKAKLQAVKELLEFVPSERLLLETDSPYLTPVPLRGTPNSPDKIKYVYDFIAQVRKTSVEELSNLVDSNIKSLFGISL